MAESNGNDKRSSERAKQRAEGLYHGNPDEAYRQSREHLVSDRHLRWTHGHDPNDPEAEEGSGWQYVTLEGPNAQERDLGDAQYRDVAGPPSRVTCWKCKSTEYLIIQERTPEEVAAEQDDVVWAQKNNREVDPLKVPRVFLLFCPTCKHTAQLREQVLRALQRKAD